MRSKFTNLPHAHIELVKTTSKLYTNISLKLNKKQEKK